MDIAAAGQYGQLTPVKTSNKTHSLATFCAKTEPDKITDVIIESNKYYPKGEKHERIT